MNNYFVILAAGKSKRFHKNIAKQFYKYKNKEIIDHSVEKSLNSNLFRKVLVVTNNLKYTYRTISARVSYLIPQAQILNITQEPVASVSIASKSDPYGGIGFIYASCTGGGAPAGLFPEPADPLCGAFLQ